MKIGLIVVLGGDLVRSTEHLGVSYIAANLRKNNYECDIIEIYGSGDQKGLKKVSRKKYDILGFTTTCVNMKDIMEIAGLLKHNTEAYITLGGHMATFWGEKILKEYRFIDSIIRGEGEITFIELVKALEANSDLSTVDGLVFRKNNEIFVNKERALIDNLDVLPFPVRDQFDEHNNRFQYIRICSSRGCLGNCGFCSSFVGREQKDFRWRGRSPENVVDEIEELVGKYDFHTFDFIDSTFEDPGKEGKARIRKIANELISRNLNIFYNCCFRAENWKEEDRELLQILIESGLEKVNIGFESGNERGLRILNKRATMEDNSNVIRLLADFPDIYITFGFIMFHPYSIMSDLKDNADFLYNTGIGQVIRHYFWKLEVYPSTRIEKKLIKDKRIKDNYDICDGMYEYQFTDRGVEMVSDICQKLLKIDAVWDFEIFDIIIHTFVTRMKRKYKECADVLNIIDGFYSEVLKMRKDMALFNYSFYCDLLENYKHYDYEAKKAVLRDKIVAAMEHIKNIQLKMNHQLIQMGYELIKKY